MDISALGFHFAGSFGPAKKAPFLARPSPNDASNNYHLQCSRNARRMENRTALQFSLASDGRPSLRIRISPEVGREGPFSLCVFVETGRMDVPPMHKRL